MKTVTPHLVCSDASAAIDCSFGHQWSIATDKKNLTPDQIKENAKALFDGPGGCK